MPVESKSVKRDGVVEQHDIDTMRSGISRLSVILALIVVLGLTASAAFVWLGIASAVRLTDSNFERLAVSIASRVHQAVNDYATAAAMIHMRCRGGSCSRTDFRVLYEYLVGVGIDFQAAEFVPNISRAERLLAEDEARAYYEEHYPSISYQGFAGLESFDSTTLGSRSDQDFYFPVHFLEPVAGNEASIGFDRYSSTSRRTAIDRCIQSGMPALTDRLHLLQETETETHSVILMHPGIKLTNQHDVWPRDLASIVIRIPNLLERSAEDRRDGYKVYVYDTSDTDLGGQPLFLGALQVTPRLGQKAELLPLNEVGLLDVQASRHYSVHKLVLFNKEWMVVVASVEGTFEPDILFIVLGGIVFVMASLCLAWWVHTNAEVNRMRAEAEKAALVLENARQAAQAERELNDFASHEVRNPVAAAMSACSFVKRAVNKDPPLVDPESLKTTREDILVIENSLKFVNDLLRNMLDIHRSACRKLEVRLAPVDILHDILAPVQAMLSQRDHRVLVSVDCPPGLIAMSDRLRLCQVIMNLGRNSVKFVNKGFIRLQAEVVKGEVELSVEDSGPGIPIEKRKFMFSKYQESLDVLSQGTGVGLFLCKSLVELMGGDIYLDETYNSGMPHCRGARIVVNLRQPPIDTASDCFSRNDAADNSGDTKDADSSIAPKLPDNLSVLFVDDDNLLRKLFCRGVKNACPSWIVREASNGETALLITETEQFDLIFMDMYMASVEKQLLGTETVQLLRANGIESRICGLSANDVESDFLEAGADAFALKPFPCDVEVLTKELYRILYS